MRKATTTVGIDDATNKKLDELKEEYDIDKQDWVKKAIDEIHYDLIYLDDSN